MSRVLIDRQLAAFERAAHPAVVVEVAKYLRQPLRLDQRNHARAQEGPDGPWAPRKLQPGRKRKRGRARRLLGRLPTAIRVSVTGATVRAESKARPAMAAAHQDGPTRVGRGAIVPQRQYLWISDELLRAAEQALIEASTRELT